MTQDELLNRTLDMIDRDLLLLDPHISKAWYLYHKGYITRSVDTRVREAMYP